MVALLPLAMKTPTSFAGLLEATSASDIADAASTLSAAVLRGDRFAAFTASDPEMRGHVLELLAEILAEHSVHVELREPEEIYQLVDGLDRADQASELAVWASAASVGDPYARRPLFVIENAETLRPHTIEFLWLAATVFLTGPLAPQILFSGDTQFQETLLSHGCRGIREHIATNITIGCGPGRSDGACGQTVETSEVLPEAPEQQGVTRPRLKWIGAAGFVLLCGAGAALAWHGYGSRQEVSQPGTGTRPAASAPLKSPTAPSPARSGPAEAAPAPTQAAGPPPVPPTPLPPEEAARPTAPDPAAGQQSRAAVTGAERLEQSRVVLLYRAGSMASESQARQIAAFLAGHVASAEIRPVPALVRASRIRYVGRDDRDAATELGALLTDSIGKARILRLAERSASVQPGVIEVQLPRPSHRADDSSRPAH